MDENIIIIGGGPSIKELPETDLRPYGRVIAANESAILMPCDVALSMDRLWMEARYKELAKKEIPTYFRRCAWKLGHSWPALNLFEGNVHVMEMSEESGVLHGKNSGACAINLAYQWRPKNIFLFGFDMKLGPNKTNYFYDDKELIDIKSKNEGKKIKHNQSNSKYAEWLKQFKFIRKQVDTAGINVLNVNTDSAIPDFEKITFEEFKSAAE